MKLKRKSYWNLALCCLLPLLLFAVIAKRSSWRPKLIANIKSAFLVQPSPDGRYLAILVSSDAARSDTSIGHTLLMYDSQTGKVTSEIKEVAGSIFFLNSSRLALRGGFNKQPLAGEPESSNRLCIYSVPDGQLIGVGPPSIIFDSALADETTLLSERATEGGLIPMRWDTPWRMGGDIRPFKEPEPALPLLEKQRPANVVLRDFQLLTDRKTLVIVQDVYPKRKSTTNNTANGANDLANFFSNQTRNNFSGTTNSPDEGLPNGSTPKASTPNGKMQTILQFWDLETKKLIFEAKPKGYVNSGVLSTKDGICAWRNDSYNMLDFYFNTGSNNGQDINNRSNKGDIEVWNYRTGKQISSFSVTGEGTGPLSPDGNLLAISQAKTIHLWDTNSRSLFRTIEEDGWVRSLNFSPDSHTLITSIDNGTITSRRLK